MLTLSCIHGDNKKHFCKSIQDFFLKTFFPIAKKSKNSFLISRFFPLRKLLIFSDNLFFPNFFGIVRTNRFPLKTLDWKVFTLNFTLLKPSKRRYFCFIKCEFRSWLGFFLWRRFNARKSWDSSLSILFYPLTRALLKKNFLYSFSDLRIFPLLQEQSNFLKEIQNSKEKTSILNLKNLQIITRGLMTLKILERPSLIKINSNKMMQNKNGLSSMGFSFEN